LFCRIHIDHFLPQASFSSFFLLSFFLYHCLPLITGEWPIVGCFVIVGDLVVELLLHPDEFGDCFSCSLLVHNNHIVHMYGLHSIVVFVHPVYSTVYTIVGVSLPYRMHVRAGCMVVQKFVYTCCAVTVYTMLVPQYSQHCPFCIHLGVTCVFTCKLHNQTLTPFSLVLPSLYKNAIILILLCFLQ
jgi:hypothetical protein